MHGDVLDIVLLVLTVLSAVAGYRRGLICGVTSFVGLLLGALLGARVAPAIARALLKAPSSTIAADHAVGQRTVTLVTVVVLAGLGHALGYALGARVRTRVLPRRLQPVDGAGGAVVSAATLLVLAWLLGAALASAPFAGLANQIHRSLVLQIVNRAVPPAGQSAASSLLREMQRHALPAVAGPFDTLLAPTVQPPNPAVVPGAAHAAAASIVKVTGDAPSCSRGIEGSGFVYAPDRVLTNAHVVAGVSAPTVAVPGGGTLPARVVLYDPNRDIAVLDVPGLRVAALSFAPQAASGASAVVAGYPEDGPFTAVPARIAALAKISGPNIYQNRTVTRQIYTIRAVVRPGNSGGPLLDPAGQVDGVVFATSVDQSDVGYALSAAEVSPDAAAGRSATAAVSTQGCD